MVLGLLRHEVGGGVLWGVTRDNFGFCIIEIERGIAREFWKQYAQKAKTISLYCGYTKAFSSLLL